MATAETTRTTQDFYLVQRLKLSPFKRAEGSPLSTKKGSNPFGYGRMGDYELDYMGSAEFEFGAIPEANNRLAAAKKGIVLDEFTYKGHAFDFMWIEKEGEPFAAWVDWAEGRRTSPYSAGHSEQQRFYGKETPYELRQRIDGEKPWSEERGWSTAIWWALKANVLWSFKEDGHLLKWIESMGSAPTEFLR